MLLLASAFFLTLLQCSDAQNKISTTSADCDTIETDAGVALDLVNRHRRDGFVFGLFRVADAHELHIDFGQCKIITNRSQLLKKPQLYGFNCTLSPVPPDLLECKDCPVKVEVTEHHKNIAAKALEKFNSESNHTNYFNVNKVEKILKMTASHEGHILEFSIKETNCSKSTQQADQALECDFLDDSHTHVGFCKARIISDPDEAEGDGTDISCEIYQPWQHNYGRRCRYSALGKPHRHPHPHHHFGHRHCYRHHQKHHHRHGFRLEDPEHNHSFNEEHQDSHEGPASPSSPQGGPHHHLHLPHHCPPPPPQDGSHTPPQEESQHPPSAPPPRDAPHHPTPSQEELYTLPSLPPPPHNKPHNPPLGPHHRPHCPPHPHGPHHHHTPLHHRPHCPFPPRGPRHHHTPLHHRPHCPFPPHGPHHHHPPPQEDTQHPSSAPPPHDAPHHPTPSQEELYHLSSPPPPHNEPQNLPLGPHHGPQCPPAPHGPHHHHSLHCGPHCPFPPHGLHHHHLPPHHGPHHLPHVCHHYYRHHCNKTSISGKYFPFQITGAVYRIPVLNQQDPLTPPTANFPELFQSNSHSSSNSKGVLFTGSSLKEMLEALGFSDHPTQSKSCPGNPKFLLPKILPLFPHSSMAENSPT